MVDISNIKNLAVIGVGTMGHEIAQVALMAGFEKVILNDLNKEILNSARIKIRKNLEKLYTKGKLEGNTTPNLLMNNLLTEIDLSEAVSNADFVIEAIPEVMELKQKLFAELGDLTPKNTILATNTSTMSITKIAAFCVKPDKVIGMHFFTPIVVLRLIELIKGEKTSEETFEISYEIAQKLPSLKGKRYIAKIQKESPGFIVNRLTIGSNLYLNWLLDEANKKGIPIETIDNDITTPPELGIYAKWDYLGLDVIYDTMKYFAKEISPDFTPGITLSNLIKEGNLGRKTGRGIYEWLEGKPSIKTTRRAEIFSSEIYYAIQLNEGCKLLEEKVVSGYKIIDDAMLAGMDIPGPFSAGRKKYQKWSELLIELSKKTGLNYFKPCDLMKSGKFINMRK
ncbi:MAG: 3-hydroxyacyl-CoA dehydrogenase family protein [Candidatus Thorarchaeota archaeon]